MRRRDELHEALRDATAVLREVGRAAEDLFGNRPPVGRDLTPPVAHAMGLVEGAAVALNATPMQLLDEYGLAF